ncbi:DNA-processing protein DprA [Halopseudomonas salegens]|uniref:DNA protecting protein DprA n=1 Tax=Halopseudomonas salegens TaxID=1434072 RepID=A0A1H2HMU6_9GAMM|nr:DNA-processing protein DprA [Halopseudomonas salegens]SDU33076.1 DNA protecting protein DprA [Halopseudomonas salegens]
MSCLSPGQRRWLLLALLPGLGPRSLQRLREQLTDLTAVFDLAPASLRALGLRPATVDALLELQQGNSALPQRLEVVENWLADSTNHLLCLNEPGYPAQLNEIADPPLVLFVRGNRALLEDPQLAMVGTRHPSPRGGGTARAFAEAFAQAGLTVTSGMALGIDAAAHQGALDGGGQTVAVWGTGLQRCYPKRHAHLAERIVEQGGALVSTFWPDMGPQPGQFPTRNRIISGLSLGTLVVEASLNSGSLITARLALEQNRELFAMPGSIHNPQARGCHRLLRDGAHLVECVQDVLQVLKLPLVAALSASQAAAAGPAARQDPLLRWLDSEPVTADWLSLQTDLPVHQVLQRLMELELDGQVINSPQGYCRQAT